MKKLSESGRQFQQIFIEHHDPETRKKREIEEKRKQRALDIKSDLGL